MGEEIAFCLLCNDQSGKLQVTLWADVSRCKGRKNVCGVTDALTLTQHTRV